MKKTVVIDSRRDGHVPFFRGVLVKSLVNTGIQFDDAYDLANRVRDDFRDVRNISTDELVAHVARLVEKRFGKDRRDRYELMHKQKARILVKGESGMDCFSVGILRHSLRACAIPKDAAAAGAVKVEEILQERGHMTVRRDALRLIVYRCLREHFSRLAADRYMSWRRFKDAGMPLVLLIGGSPGSGKSTVAAELAYRLNIPRIQSTDMMREVIRSYLTPQVAPTLQYSSFEAWRGLAVPRNDQAPEEEDRLVNGFLSQVSVMRPALQAAMERAVQEGEHLILEGVHVLPFDLDIDAIRERAIVISLMLSTIEKDVLRARLRRRGSDVGERHARRYLEHLDEIWELQSFLVGEAESADINVMPTGDIETTIGEILDLISRIVMKRFPGHSARKDGQS